MPTLKDAVERFCRSKNIVALALFAKLNNIDEKELDKELDLQIQNAVKYVKV